MNDRWARWIGAVAALCVAAATSAQDGPQSLPKVRLNAGIHNINAELATTSSAKSITAFVAEFTDPGQADRAWNAGVFGFVPPAPGELPAGVTSGTGTGLGLSSWTYDRPPVHLASWHKSVFVALVVVSNLDVPTFKTVTTAIDARLN